MLLEGITEGVKGGAEHLLEIHSKGLESLRASPTRISVLKREASA
jgi:hypothetical protein